MATVGDALDLHRIARVGAEVHGTRRCHRDGAQAFFVQAQVSVAGIALDAHRHRGIGLNALAYAAGYVVGEAHGLGRLPRSGLLRKFRPDAPPRLLAKLLPGQFAARLMLNAASLGRVHVSTPGKALIQILLTEPVGGGQLFASFGRDLCGHRPSLAKRYVMSSVSHGRRSSVLLQSAT